MATFPPATDIDAMATGETAVAQEYFPGELAPSIVTPSRVWRPDDLPDRAMAGLIGELVKKVSSADEAARRFQVLQTWEMRHMDRGYQYLENDGRGGWRIAGTNGATRSGNSLAAMDDAGLYPTNILSAQGDILTSALCRGEIKVSFQPKNSKDPADSACADEANKYRHLWAAVNRSPELQRALMGLGWTDCRALVWTRSMADKSRFGEEEGTARVAEVSTVHGVLESKLPMMIDTLAEASFAQIFDEIDYAVARAQYPWMGDKIKPSWGTAGELEFERIARINTRIGIVGKYITGTSGIRAATMAYTWFRPGMFFDDEIGPTQREWLLANFPAGLLVVMAGPELCCCWNESMDDHLALGLYTRGFGQNRRSLGSSDLPLQKRINIWADLWDKFVRTAIPITVLDADTYNAEAISELEASPARFLSAAAPEGQSLAGTMAQTPPPTPVPGMPEMFQWYVGPLMQSIDGATPALFGLAEGADNTVGATEIRLQQALERIGTAWAMANQVFAAANEQAVRCCAENGRGEIHDSIQGEGDVSVNPANLKGNVRCHAETLGTIPQSGAQREAKVMQVLGMAASDPQIAAAVGRPSNAREIVRALHIEDVLTIEEAHSEDLALENIEALLDAMPLLNPAWVKLAQQEAQQVQAHEAAKSLAAEATAQGAPPPPEAIAAGAAMEAELAQLQQQLAATPKYLPSVPVVTDGSQDNGTIADTVFSWMQQPEGRALRKAAAQEPEGAPNWAKWTNVYLYWKGNRDQVEQQAMENQPPVMPKVSISIPADKMPSVTQAELLQRAGIQATPQPQQPHEVEQETRLYGPAAEVATKTKRKL